MVRQRFNLDDFLTWPKWVQDLIWHLGDCELAWSGPPLIWSRG